MGTKKEPKTNESKNSWNTKPRRFYFHEKSQHAQAHKKRCHHGICEKTYQYFRPGFCYFNSFCICKVQVDKKIIIGFNFFIRYSKLHGQVRGEGNQFPLTKPLNILDSQGISLYIQKVWNG